MTVKEFIEKWMLDDGQCSVEKYEATQSAIYIAEKLGAVTREEGIELHKTHFEWAKRRYLLPNQR